MSSIKNSFCAFLARVKTYRLLTPKITHVHLLVLIWEPLQTLTTTPTTTTPDASTTTRATYRQWWEIWCAGLHWHCLGCCQTINNWRLQWIWRHTACVFRLLCFVRHVTMSYCTWLKRLLTIQFKHQICALWGSSHPNRPSPIKYHIQKARLWWDVS